MEKATWEQVSQALETLLDKTRENEPHAVNFIGALEAVLLGLPSDEDEA